jgi:beta-lactamase superfamily II metal-dependent hydrolase
VAPGFGAPALRLPRVSTDATPSSRLQCSPQTLVSGIIGGDTAAVIAPPPGELFSETNDNSVFILLTYGTARVLLAGDAEAREEEYMAGGPYTGSLIIIKVQNYKTARA